MKKSEEQHMMFMVANATFVKQGMVVDTHFTIQNMIQVGRPTRTLLTLGIIMRICFPRSCNILKDFIYYVKYVTPGLTNRDMDTWDISKRIAQRGCLKLLSKRYQLLKRVNRQPQNSLENEKEADDYTPTQTFQLKRVINPITQQKPYVWRSKV